MKRECNKNKENEMIKGMDLNKACVIPSYSTFLMQCLSLLVRLGMDTFTQNGIRLIHNKLFRRVHSIFHHIAKEMKKYMDYFYP